MGERLLETDPLTGQKTFFSFDDETEAITLRTAFDVESLIDTNKRIQNIEPDHFRGDVHRVASIPLNVYFDLKRQGIIGNTPEHWKKTRAWLNNSDNLAFRTKLGKV